MSTVFWGFDGYESGFSFDAVTAPDDFRFLTPVNDPWHIYKVTELDDGEKYLSQYVNPARTVSLSGFAMFAFPKIYNPDWMSSNVDEYTIGFKWCNVAPGSAVFGVSPNESLNSYRTLLGLSDLSYVATGQSVYIEATFNKLTSRVSVFVDGVFIRELSASYTVNLSWYIGRYYVDSSLYMKNFFIKDIYFKQHDGSPDDLEEGRLGPIRVGYTPWVTDNVVENWTTQEGKTLNDILALPPLAAPQNRDQIEHMASDPQGEVLTLKPQSISLRDGERLLYIDPLIRAYRHTGDSVALNAQVTMNDVETVNRVKPLMIIKGGTAVHQAAFFDDNRLNLRTGFNQNSNPLTLADFESYRLSLRGVTPE